MGNVIQVILDNLYKLWPVRSIDADCQGVKFSGANVSLLLPGRHFFFPGFQNIEEWSVKYQEIDCLTQSVETRDGVAITFSANIGYIIEDAVKMRTEVHNFDGTLERALRGELAEAVSQRTYAELGTERRAIARKTLESLRREAGPWGVTIRKVRWTDRTRSEQQRRFITTDAATREEHAK